MLYTLEQGPVEKRIIEQCFRERLPLPMKIQNAPQLYLGLELYLGAYFDLQSCRPSGWGDAVIPWLTVDDYATRRGLDDEQREDLQVIVRRLDEEYLSYRESKRPKSDKGGLGGKSRRVRSKDQDTRPESG